MSLEKRKNRIGRVVSDKMDKTVIVAVQRQRNHYLYKKPVRMTSKFYAHDGRNECSVGDLVKIEECRPLSALKRWRVTGILERRDVVEVAGIELEQSIIESDSDSSSQPNQADLMIEDTPEQLYDETVISNESDTSDLQLNEAIQELDNSGHQLESSDGDGPDDGVTASDSEIPEEKSR